MPYTSYIQLASSGSFRASSNGELSLAFNDNIYSDNEGQFTFNLFLSGNLIQSVSVLGNYSTWNPAFNLIAGNTYTYTADGLIFGNTGTPWAPEGWVGHKGSDTILLGASLTQSYNFANYGPWGDYFNTTVFNPLDTNALVSLDSSTSIGGTLIVNGQTASQQNGDYQYGNLSPFVLGPNQAFSFHILNGPSPRDPDSPSWVGGTVNFNFTKFDNSFLVPQLTAYSLVGRFIGLDSPNVCAPLFNQNYPNPNLPSGTGQGYIPETGYVIPTVTPTTSGVLFLEITNTGSSCGDGELLNKITEFNITSHYSESTNLEIRCDFAENNTSYAKYLAFTQDVPYSYSYTGYTTLTGYRPITVVTGYRIIGLSGLIPYTITGSDGGVQICYTSGITGSGFSPTSTGILNILFNQADSGIVSGGSGYIYYEPYYIQSGTGVITEYISGFDPQMSVYQDNGLLSYNNDWIDSPYSSQIEKILTGIFSGSGSGQFKLPSIESANLFDVIGGSGFNLNINKYPDFNLNNRVYKNSTTLKLIQDSGYKFETYYSPLAAWASYNVTTGTNSKNVIGYAIEIVNDLILSGQTILDTGIKNSPPSLFTTGTDVRTDYIGYCIVNTSEECKDKEFPDINICYTGDPNSTGYNSFLSGVINKFASSATTEFDVENSLIVSSGVIPSYFRFWSGEINFNTFVSGDTLTFNLYPFDYTGLYNRYFNTNPLYPSTGLTLTYPVDFNNITSLVSKINEKLSGVNYPVWYPYDCISGSGQQGIYASGGLMAAKIKNLPTGNANYNNIIEFYSLRNNTGYNFKLNLQPRPIIKQNSNNQLKYLLPSYISLQGSNDNSTWTTLDVQSGINWTGIEPTSLITSGLESGLPTDITIIDDDPFEDEIEVEESQGGFQNLYSFTQRGAVQLSPKCAPISFEREISIIRPTGFPPDVQIDPKTCAPSSKEDEEGDKEENNQGTGIQNTGNPLYISNFLRTGWVLDPAVVGSPITGINYNYYRIYLSGFQGDNVNYQTLSNTFIVNNINLFSSEVVSGVVHTGQQLCGIGADYVAQVQGIVPVVITGYLTGNIRPQDSGIRCFNNALVIGEISGKKSGDYVKFNNESGRLTSDFGTGNITACFTGTGCFQTGIDGFFYDTGTNIVTTEMILTACTSGGSGFYTGNWIQLKQSVVNRELALGGFLNPVQFVTITTGAFFTGIIPGRLTMENLNGFFYLPINITGQAISGQVYFSQCYTGQTPQLYYGEPTGYKNSSVTLTYNNPEIFDFVAINGKTIYYNTDTVNYQAPDFFSSYSSLLDIINTNPSVFNVTGSGNGTNIYLTSLLSGESGNSIALNYGTSTGSPYFSNPNFLTGGIDYYQVISGTGTYSGCINIIVPMTGFYISNSGTGNLTGDVSTFLGVREITGIWNIVTGNHPNIVNFQEANMFYGSLYSGNISGNNLGIDPSRFNIYITYNNIFNSPNFDVVQLSIYDSNWGTGTGVNLLLSGI